MKPFQQRLMLGAAFLLPFTVILVLLREALNLAKKITAPILPYFADFVFGGIGAATIIALVFLFVVCWSAGWMATTKSGKKTEAFLENYLLQFIPGYSMIRTVLYDVAGRQEAATVIPAMARIEDSWQWGFITDTLDSGLLAVYVPGAPSMSSGSIYFLTEDRVKRITLPTQKIYGNLRRYGYGSRELLKGQL